MCIRDSTNDGVTIAKEIELKDEFENMGAQLVREAVSYTHLDVYKRQRFLNSRHISEQAVRRQLAENRRGPVQHLDLSLIHILRHRADASAQLSYNINKVQNQ